MSEERPAHLRLEIATSLVLFVGLGPIWPLLDWLLQSSWDVPADHERAPGAALFLLQVYLFVWLSLRWRGERWADIGFPRFHPPLDIAFGLFVFFAGHAVDTLSIFVLHPLEELWPGEVAPPLRGAWPLVLLGLVGTACTSVAEEVYFRGYLLKRFATASGSAASALIWTSLLFGAMHTYQGLGRPLMTAAWGLILGAFVLVLKRVWPAVIAHVLTNLYIDAVNAG